MMKPLYLVLIFGCLCKAGKGQDTPRLRTSTLVNVDYHHGQLQPVVGVHNIQTMRALRSKLSNSWTYNHAPMLAYWNNCFYLEYLSNPVGEHVPPGQSFLQSSTDGYHWSDPVIVFPPYKVPEGHVKSGRTENAHDLWAVMHQRIGFFTSSDLRFFVLGYYGIVLGKGDDPNDGNGIGRVIREIKKDGSFGPIYFLRLNHGFSPANTDYPFYASSKDKGFVKACEELLSSPLQMQQMVEEADRNDPLIPLKKDFKAFNYYHLPDGKIVGWWKYALTSVSNDEGRTWQYSPLRAPGFVNANAKIWSQKLVDGKYATIYNPSEFRWPLAISLSNNGLDYEGLYLINGEISSLRYGGAYKSYGPQYIRGIQETDGRPNDSACWVTYSMNKEDIWVSRIPVPVLTNINGPVMDQFGLLPRGRELDQWNIYSPLWCKVQIEGSGIERKLTLHDSDPFDYAKAERVFEAGTEQEIKLTLAARQSRFGRLEIELTDAKGTPCIRLILDSTGTLSTKVGYRNKSLGKYEANQKIELVLKLNCTNRFYTLSLNGKPAQNLLCFAPVASVERMVFRTGTVRRFPDADTPTDQEYDLKDTERREEEAVFEVWDVEVKSKNSKIIIK